LLLIHEFDGMMIVLYDPDHKIVEQEAKTETVIEEREQK